MIHTITREDIGRVLGPRLNSIDPALTPVASKEEIIDRIIDGPVPRKRIYSIYVSPEGYLMSEDEAIQRLAADVGKVYAEMTSEELEMFRSILSHLYWKRQLKLKRTVRTASKFFVAVALFHFLFQLHRR